jgi:preprotein translocase subunit YajC
MHHLLTLLAQTTPTTKAGKSKSSSSSYLPLLVIIIIFAAVWILFIRPRQQRARQQQSASRQISVGDRVMSAGGIYGTVVAIDSDVVEVEVSPGVVMTFVRRAISPRPGGPPPGQESPPPIDDKWDFPSQSGNDHPAGKEDLPEPPRRGDDDSTGSSV